MAKRYGGMTKKTKDTVEHEMVDFIHRKAIHAVNREDSELSNLRASLLGKYYGEVASSENEGERDREGYSNFVTREILETVEFAMPTIMRTLYSSDKVVEFNAIGPEDEATAAQETDVINHKLLRANDGDAFLEIHNFIKNALIYPTSYAKIYIEDKEETVFREKRGILADELSSYIGKDNEDMEVLGYDSEIIDIPTEVEVPGPPPQPGQPPAPPQMQTVMQPTEVYSLRYREKRERQTLRITAVPPEEVLLDTGLMTHNLDECSFIVHRVRKTASELRAMGIDPDELGGDSSGTLADPHWHQERVNRLLYANDHEYYQQEDAETDAPEALGVYWLMECYLLYDFDQDGIAERRRVVLAGSEIIENEVTDFIPLVSMSALLMPNVHNGLSLAQVVESLQDLLTTLTRNLLDNTYRMSINRKYIDERAFTHDGLTLEGLLNTHSEYVPVRGAPAEMVLPEPRQSIIGDVLPVIQDTRANLPRRTGISADAGIDPAMLQNTTAGAYASALDKASDRLELITTVMAETGLKPLYRKAHYLFRTNPDIAQTVKLRGEWIPIDPESWDERTDVSVSVGLGFLNKQQMVMSILHLISMQQEAGPTLVDDRRKYEALSTYIKASGLGNPADYFANPVGPEALPEPGPDAQVELFNAQTEELRAKVQREGALAQAKIEGEKEQIALDKQKQMVILDKERMENSMKAEELKLKMAEMELKQMEMEIKKEELMQASQALPVELQAKLADISKTKMETFQIQANIEKIGADIDNTDASTEVLEEEAKTVSRDDSTDQPQE